MDQSLLLIINQTWTNPALDRIMATASSIGFWMPVFFVGGILLLIFGGFRARMMLLTVAISIMVVDGVIVNVTKKLVGRPRPEQVLSGVRQLDLARAKPRILAAWRPLHIDYSAPKTVAKTGRSFPSGHAANNFAFATVLVFFYRRWGWLYYIPASIVAYSRIYVGSHWPSDILLSCLIGLVVTIIVVKCLECLWARYAARFFPKLYENHPQLIAS